MEDGLWINDLFHYLLFGCTSLTSLTIGEPCVELIELAMDDAHPAVLDGKQLVFLPHLTSLSIVALYHIELAAERSQSVLKRSTFSDQER